MTAREPTVYGDVDPRDQAAYTVAEAASYLGIPPSTVRLWALGQPYPTRRHGSRHAPALFRAAEREPLTLSFWNLVEAYVVGSIRRRHGIAMQKVRRALRYVEEQLEISRPLVSQQFLTDGVDLFVERYGRLVSASAAGQLAMRDLLRGALQRIERDVSGLADRLFPWIVRPDEPRAVEIDPHRAFGRLVVAGTGIPTDVLADRFRGAESIESIASDYSLSAAQVEAAIRWELSVRAA